MDIKRPIFATHWFNWYVVSPKRPLKDLEKRWTHKPIWEKLGIPVDEIGISRRYYQKQFKMIKEAGFDGLMWEWHSRGLPRVITEEAYVWKWHGSNPPDVAIESAKELGLKFGMFYDMEIRNRSLPNFITPTQKFMDSVIDDVAFFYRGIPKELWLFDRENRATMIFYGYKFDDNNMNVDAWKTFYRYIIEGIKNELSSNIVIHWTYAHKAQQLYGYLNFDEIKSFAFNWVRRQNCTNTDSVTFVVGGYDDFGVYEGGRVRGGRIENRIVNDIRFIEEGTWLAQKTNPSFFFFYGWNELYEGEGLVPDETYGFARYNLAKAIVKHLKETVTGGLENALIITDDILELATNLPDIAEKEINVLLILRAICPANKSVITGKWDREIVKDYPLIIALNVAKNPEEDHFLKSLTNKKVVYFSSSSVFHSSDRPYIKKGTFYTAYYRIKEASEPGYCKYKGEKKLLKDLFEDAMGKKLRDGLIFCANVKSVRLDQILIQYETNPSIIERAELPVDKIVYACPQALEEDVMILPMGKTVGGFRFLRGEKRKIEVRDDRFVLRYPEIVEVNFKSKPEG